jgi:hypothetical protein
MRSDLYVGWQADASDGRLGPALASHCIRAQLRAGALGDDHDNRPVATPRAHCGVWACATKPSPLLNIIFTYARA